MVRFTGDVGVARGTVAVGVDGSPGSSAALAEAVDEAVAQHRSLTILHAAGPGRTPQRVLDDARDEVERRAPGLETHLVLHVGDPGDVLEAASRSAAVLVVGSRGRGPVRSLLLGSVGLAITRHAACPVVVVRPHHPGLVRRGVLVGTDGASGSLRTLDFAFQQASTRRLPLTVLHTVVPSPGGAPQGESPEEHRLLVAEAMSGLREIYPDVSVRVAMATGQPADVLVRAAERMDLVVVGAHRGGRAAELVHNSVAASVVERARCAVAVVPTADGAVTAH